MIKAEITDKELKTHLESLEEDKLRIFTMADGRVRGALFHGSRFVNQMRVQHNLGILETMILGQAGLCAALTIPMMKDREHTVIKYEGTGSAEGYSLEADSTGYVRGYLYNEHIKLDKPLENWDLKPFLGVGNLTFSRVHPDDKYPQQSTVDVDDGNIAKDFAWYFSQSEQLKTAFNTSVQFDKQGRVVGAGAMYLQIMPKTGGTKGIGSQVDSHQEESEEEEDLIRRVENAFTARHLANFILKKLLIQKILFWASSASSVLLLHSAAILFLTASVMKKAISITLKIFLQKKRKL